ncbi:hypothetical protein RUND412_000886 [Rhizina undulata]
MSTHHISYPPNHPLNHITLTLPSTPPSPGAWLLYIHGGAWRDPTVTSATADPLFTHLRAIHPRLATASISYRLSPHPAHPHLKDENNTRHPDHIDDVCSAIRELIEHWGLKLEDAVLVGHSAGATLAFQALGRWLQEEGGSGKMKAVVGVEGIYDLRDLLEEYSDYESFISGAFGVDRDVWDSASPVSASYTSYKGKLVLVHSDDDELLSWRQTTDFQKTMEAQGVEMDVRKVGGKHDEVPAGKELAEIVSALVDS